jgi:hypothetical protein
MFKSGDSYTAPVLRMGNNYFLQDDTTVVSRAAGNRIWCNTNNPKSGIASVQVTKVKRFPVRNVRELRMIAEMIRWCLTDGYYMDIHAVHGYLQNKYMCLMLTGHDRNHPFSLTEADIGVEYIMAYLNAASNGRCTAVAQHVINVAGRDLAPLEMRVSAHTWYQLLLNDIADKINKLEKEAA